MKDGMKYGIGALVGILVMGLILTPLFLLKNGLSSFQDVSYSKEAALTDSEIEKINEELGMIYKNKIQADEIPRKQIIDGLLLGATKSLDDPYSYYYPAKDAEKFFGGLEDSISGIGVVMQQTENGIVVTKTIAGSPAASAGILPGDIIYKVNGKEMTELSLDEVSSHVLGEAGTEVKITFLRSGTEVKKEIKRAIIDLKTVHTKMYTKEGKKVGYIRIDSFGVGTGDEFKKALSSLEKNKITGLVVDLRNNGGGLLSELDKILNELVTKEEPYLVTKNTSGKEKKYYTDNTKDVPYDVVTLVNENTASASEIFATAMIDVEDFDVVGKTTYGKGVVQAPFEMKDGSVVKLTIEKWYRNTGKTIDKKGVDPTINVDASKVEYNIFDNVIKKPLKKGDRSVDIIELKGALHDLSYPVPVESLTYDDALVSTVKAFQKNVKLKETGTIDTATLILLQQKYEELLKSPVHDAQLSRAIKEAIK